METKDIQETSVHFVDEYDITLAVLFGSHARGTAHAQSDVDIAFLMDPHIETDRLAGLQTALTNALGIRADIVDIAGAPPLLLRKIAID